MYAIRSYYDITPVAGASLSLIQPREAQDNLVLRYQVPQQIPAPVAHEQSVGEVIVEQEGRLVVV